MLAKQYRYSFTFGVPEKSYSHSCFLIKYRRRDEGELKVAIVVSKKVHKSSVTRHALKRKLAEAIKEACTFKERYDVVLYLRKPVIEHSVDSLSDVLKTAFEEIKKDN